MGISFNARFHYYRPPNKINWNGIDPTYLLTIEQTKKQCSSLSLQPHRDQMLIYFDQI
uniref:Uncharacterized protein n=1 Tax=Arundo donax TaxID=35708 RepID=A0A0A9FNM3_ARUDO